MALYNPPQFINGYPKDKLQEFDFGSVPFFPTSPSTLDELTQSVLVGNSAGLMAVYDRMLRFRRTKFPHIKTEQILYYFYGTASGNIDALMEATQTIQDLLDDEDESAQEVNLWAEAKQSSATPLVDSKGELLLSPYFHRIKVYQLEEARDIVDFGTARTFAGNKIIIDYDWHKS
jgi:hypothetical protein